MLRWANSSAYYALFHLLIWEATANRPLFGRMFERGTMKFACSQILDAEADAIIGIRRMRFL